MSVVVVSVVCGGVVGGGVGCGVSGGGGQQFASSSSSSSSHSHGATVTQHQYQQRSVQGGLSGSSRLPSCPIGSVRSTPPPSVRKSGGFDDLSRRVFESVEA
ncbi:hypothetical protein CRUP_022481 [Coryphaenoides rupestris]|nr:hypothetical protein CRUP_022481 [Coryphaenoides rupestris]